jgi:hypothetical protein
VLPFSFDGRPLSCSNSRLNSPICIQGASEIPGELAPFFLDPLRRLPRLAPASIIRWLIARNDVHLSLHCASSYFRLNSLILDALSLVFLVFGSLITVRFLKLQPPERNIYVRCRHSHHP